MVKTTSSVKNAVFALILEPAARRELEVIAAS
jgi:hypothetical protein